MIVRFPFIFLSDQGVVLFTDFFYIPLEIIGRIKVKVCELVIVKKIL